MELVSNLLWLAVSLTLLAGVWLGVRRGRIQASMPTAMTLALTTCFILLPAISISDDILEARQAALPLSAQTWRVASEALTTGLDVLVAVAACLLFLASPRLRATSGVHIPLVLRPFALRLVRSQRLRPPLAAR